MLLQQLAMLLARPTRALRELLATYLTAESRSAALADRAARQRR